MSDLPQLSDAFVCVDYSDIDSMAKVLDENKVHTVISALRVFDSATSLAESNLVKAAAKSDSTKRFVASAWGIHNAETYPFPFIPPFNDIHSDIDWIGHLLVKPEAALWLSCA